MTNYEKIHRLMYLTYTSPAIVNTLFSFFNLQENNKIPTFRIIYNSNININSITDFLQDSYILEFNSSYLNTNKIQYIYNDLFNEIMRFCFGYYDEVQDKDNNAWNNCYDSFINSIKQQINIKYNNVNLLFFNQLKDDKILPQQKYLLNYDTIINHTYNWQLMLFLALQNNFFISTCLEKLQIKQYNIDLSIKALNRKLNKAILDYEINQSYFSILFYFSQYIKSKVTLTNFLAVIKKINQSNLSVDIIMQLLLLCIHDNMNMLFNAKEWKNLYNKKLRKGDNIREVLINNLNYSFFQLYDEF